MGCLCRPCLASIMLVVIEISKDAGDTYGGCVRGLVGVLLNGYG